MQISGSSTPFEKSLAKRVFKANEILRLVTLKETYTTQSDVESTFFLSTDLSLLSEQDSSFFEYVNRYYVISIKRKELFQGRKFSIKDTALLIKNSIHEDGAYRADYRKEIKDIYNVIKKQNPIPPPIDFAVKSFEKDISMFFRSHDLLLVQFRNMISFLESIPYHAKTNECSIEQCKKLVSEAEGLNKEIDTLLQKIFIINEKRLETYTRIRERCLAINHRFRYLFGSHDALYKEINRLRL